MTPSASFVAEATIMITGGRSDVDPVRIEVVGETTGLVGAQVTPHYRFRHQKGYTPGTGVRTVDSEGTFSWSRKSKHKTYVYFTGGDAKSNLVVFPAL